MKKGLGLEIGTIGGLTAFFGAGLVSLGFRNIGFAVALIGIIIGFIGAGFYLHQQSKNRQK